MLPFCSPFGAGDPCPQIGIRKGADRKQNGSKAAFWRAFFDPGGDPRYCHQNEKAPRNGGAFSPDSKVTAFCRVVC